MKWVLSTIGIIVVFLIIIKLWKIENTDQYPVVVRDTSYHQTSFTPVIDTVAIAEEKIKNEALIKKLKAKFIEKKDEFSSTSIVRHKASPEYVNYNGVFFRFTKNDQQAEDLSLRVQYADDDWLFIKRAIFNIDGENTEVLIDKVERDNSDGRIYEWFNLDYGQYSGLFFNLSKAKKVKIKFIGSQYYDIRTLNQKQIGALKETFDYYKALRGKTYFY